MSNESAVVSLPEDKVEFCSLVNLRRIRDGDGPPFLPREFEQPPQPRDGIELLVDAIVQLAADMKPLQEQVTRLQQQLTSLRDHLGQCADTHQPRPSRKAQFRSCAEAQNQPLPAP